MRRFWLLGLLVVAVLAACLSETRAPALRTGRALAPSDLHGAGAGQGKFRVIFAAPDKQAPTGSEISFVFDRPLRALGDASVAAPSFRVEPPIPGSFQWVGARAVSFVPSAGALPNATEILVVVPKELQALDGSLLSEPFELRFQTPRPALVSVSPAEGETGVLPNAAIELTLNQRVDPKVLARALRLTSGRSTFPLEVARSAEGLNTFTVKTRALPLDTDVTLTLSAKLVSEEGSLPSGTERKVTFHTLAPLKVEGIDCNRETPHGRCAPGYGVGLRFSNPVRVSALRNALTLPAGLSIAWSTVAEGDEETSYLSLPEGLKPASRSTVRIAASLKDIHGQPLGKEYVGQIEMDDYFPGVALGVTDGALIPDERGPIPIAAVNAPGAKVVYTALTRDDVFAARSEDDLIQRVLGSASAKSLSLASSPPNQVSKAWLDPSKVLGSQSNGVLGVVADYQRHDHAGHLSRARATKLGDLAITAKFSRLGSWVWVTRLSSAAKVTGVELELRRADGAPLKKTTNSDGVAFFSAAEFAPNLDYDSKDREAVLYAALGTEWTFERVGDLLESWRLPVRTDFSFAEQVQGLVFTDRGVYRPGDRVLAKGVVRREAGRNSGIPVGESLSFELVSPGEGPIVKHRLSVSRFGTFADELVIPETAGLGYYEVRATFGKQLLQTAISVQEYRPNEFELTARAPNTAVRGQSVRVELEGQYLFGAPMRAAKADFWLSRSATSWQPPNSERFATSPQDYYADLNQAGFDAGGIGRSEGALDANGKWSANANLPMPGQLGPELVRINAEVRDVSRQSVAATASVLVHPGEFYLGIERLREGFVAVGEKLELGVAALGLDGRRLAQLPVQVKLLRRRWVSARPTGYYGEVYRVEDRAVGECSVTTQTTALRCAFEPKEPGYYIALASTHDVGRNQIQAAASWYVTGEGEASFRGGDNGEVELVLDKPSYRVGELARVLVKSRYKQAEALITVERSDVQLHERKTLRGGAPTFAVRVTEAMRPNVFVSALLQPALGRGASAEPARAFGLGYAELKVEPESRRLQVGVLPAKAQVLPGDQLDVTLRVRDAADRPALAEVTFLAVDEGVLALTGYQLPDPVAAMLAPRPLQVASLETRASLARISQETAEQLLGLGKGSEAGGGGDLGSRADFRATAVFLPNLVTDAKGEARARFKLPDSLTRYRLMAMAVSEADRFGVGQSSVTVSRKLMARPALPRFLRAGDSFEAALIVSAKQFDPGEVKVRLQASGVELAGPATQSVRVAANGQAELRFAARAPRVGKAAFTFEVSAGAERDRVALTRTVRAPLVLETTALSGQSQGAVQEQLGNLQALRSDVGGLDVSLSNSALVGIEAALEGLEEYPYGCTEQLASRLLALGPLSVLRRDFGKPVSAEQAALARKIVAELLQRQRGDGGFSFWPGSRESHPWLSAYSLWVLHVAKLAKLEVPDKAFVGGRRYLRQFLAEKSREFLDAERAFALDVLSELGAPDVGYMNQLFEARAQLSVLGRALLLHAFARQKSATQVNALLADLETRIRLANAEAKVIDAVDEKVPFDSVTRTHAALLWAMSHAKPEHPLLPALARGLLAARGQGQFRSTQEAGFALLALESYQRLAAGSSAEFSGRVRLGERSLFERSFQAKTATAAHGFVAMQELARAGGTPLTFEIDGRGTLFYEARLRYARASLPTSPLDAGFFVEKRQWTLREGERQGAYLPAPAVSDARFPAGGRVLTEIILVSPEPREFVVVDDALPAGFEAINTEFETSSELDRRLECGECEAESSFRRRAYVRKEVRDDRVLFFADHLAPGVYRYRYVARASTIGNFVTPPTRAEAMYAPEFFGRAAAAQIEVR